MLKWNEKKSQELQTNLKILFFNKRLITIYKYNCSKPTFFRNVRSSNLYMFRQFQVMTKTRHEIVWCNNIDAFFQILYNQFETFPNFFLTYSGNCTDFLNNFVWASSSWIQNNICIVSQYCENKRSLLADSSWLLKKLYLKHLKKLYCWVENWNSNC